MQNSRNPALRRIMSEWKELQRNRSNQLTAHPLEDNMFEWHFTIRGPADSDFAGGLYHGRILLPHNYPMKPPNIVFLTPNGRFEIGMKICLTVSAHHPETWQPSWSIRTVLIAIIGFMPSAGNGAIGSIDFAPDVRQQMARESLGWCCSVCQKSNVELLPLVDEDQLRASASDLSTSVNAVLDDQSRFPTTQIAIEKIERLDDDRQQQKPAPQPEPVAAAPVEAAAPVPVVGDAAAAADAAAAPVRLRAVPTAGPGLNLIDASIAAVYFAMLYLVLNKYITV